MPDRRILAFPPATTAPFPVGAMVLLDHTNENTFAADIQTVVEVALGRMPPVGMTPAPSDFVPVLRSGTVYMMPGQLFGSLIPVVNSTNPGMMSVADKAKLDGLSSTAIIPPGGTAGQVLGKLSDLDFVMGWVNQTGSGGGGTGELDDIVNNGAGTGVGVVIGVAGGIATLRKILSNTSNVTIGTNADGNLTIDIGLASTSVRGLMSQADKTKLETIASGAQPNPPVYAGLAEGIVPAPSALPAAATKFLAETGAWIVPAGSGGSGEGGIPDAPVDTQLYGRRDGAWDVINEEIELSDLTDVSVGSAVTGSIMRYDGSLWVASAEGPFFLANLQDVDIGTLTIGDQLTWDGTKWANAAPTAATGGAALGSPLTGPVTHPYAAGDADDVIRCNIAAGDVTVTLDDTVSTPAGRVLTTSFITEGGNGAYKLKFANIGSNVQPNVIQSAASFRTTGIPTTALVGNTSDNRSHSAPIGDDRAMAIFLFALRANDANPNEMRLQLTIDGGTMFEVGDVANPWTNVSSAVSADADIFTYVRAMGSDSDTTPFTSKVIHTGLNCCGYVLMITHADHVDQTTPYEAITAGHDDGPSSTAMTMLINVLGPNRRVVYATLQTVNTTGYPVPTVAGATQLQAGTLGTSAVLNAAGGPYMLAQELATSSGTYDCTVTFPAINDRSRIALAFRPASVASMDIRTPGNVAAETAVTNKQVGLIYDGNAKIANLIF